MSETAKILSPEEELAKIKEQNRIRARELAKTVERQKENTPLEYENPLSLYEDIRNFLVDNIDLYEEAHYDVLTTKVMESWLIDKFNELAYVFFLGPSKSGKTRAMDTLSKICFNPKVSAYMTAPSIYRTLDKGPATLFLDEIQQYLQEDKAVLMAILNSGQRRGQKAILTVRTVDGWDAQGFEVFGSKFLASTEETLITLTSRCIIITMIKNARRIPLRINRETAKKLRRQLLKYKKDMEDKTLPDMEQTFLEMKFADNRNIEAFINLVTVAPPEKQETILKYAKEIDDMIAEEEGISFYADLYTAIEFAYKGVKSGKISIQSIAKIYNEGIPEEECITNQSVGYQLNIMGLRRKCRMTGGRIGRIINKKIMARLKRRYSPEQKTLDIDENSEHFEHFEDLPVYKEEDITPSKKRRVGSTIERVSSLDTSIPNHDSLHTGKPSKYSLSSLNSCVCAICRVESDDLVTDKKGEFLICKKCKGET